MEKQTPRQAQRGQESEEHLPSSDGDLGPDGVASLNQEVLDRAEEVARTTATAVVRHEQHSGPIPSPRDFALYDKILPGTAQVIRDEFVINAKHVRELQSLALTYQKDDNDKNRKVAERLVWGSLIAAVLLALMGREVVAGILAASTIGAVIAGFLKVRWEGKEGKESKPEIKLNKRGNDGEDEEKPPNL